MHRLGLHLAVQRGIHQLVARDGALALELRRDDDGKPVAAVALDLHVLARQAGGNQRLNLFSIHGIQFLNL